MSKNKGLMDSFFEKGDRILKQDELSGEDKVFIVIEYLVIGAIIGFAVGAFIFVIAFFMTFSLSKALSAYKICISITTVLGGLGGILIIRGAVNKGIENMKKHAFNTWKAGLDYQRDCIDNNRYNLKNFNFDEAFNKIKVFYQNYPTVKNSHNEEIPLTASDISKYDNEYNKVIQSVASILSETIDFQLLQHPEPKEIANAAIALGCLKKVKNNDNKYDPAITVLNQFSSLANEPTIYIKQRKYGDFEFPLDNPQVMQNFDINANSIIRDIEQKYNIKKFDQYYTQIPQNFTVDLLNNIAGVLWYYAKKRPFDRVKFDEAKERYNKYLNFATNGATEYRVKAEVVLAEIYAKKQIGGESLIRQDFDSVNKWLEDKYNYKAYDACRKLASGLAWMELYTLERDVLRKLFKLGFNLNKEEQERLNFLENGGTRDIKIYNVPDNRYCYFDSSAIDWHEKEIDLFFRKLVLEHRALLYSLLRDKWTKTIPLQKGQQIDSNLIYQKLRDMASDFGGEVIYSKKPAKSVDMSNIVYNNCVCFGFKNRRSKCTTMLFTFEQYGPNLNVTIFTLFTPENNVTYNDMKQYALSVKSNPFLTSFRESVLQVLDSALKVEEDIYDNTHKTNNKIFFE